MLEFLSLAGLYGQEPTQTVEHLKGASLRWALALLANIIPITDIRKLQM
jgi:hypothetical protein